MEATARQRAKALIVAFVMGALFVAVPLAIWGAVVWYLQLDPPQPR
jgi:hypothetical protein